MSETMNAKLDQVRKSWVMELQMSKTGLVSRLQALPRKRRFRAYKDIDSMINRRFTKELRSHNRHVESGGEPLGSMTKTFNVLLQLATAEILEQMQTDTFMANYEGDLT